MKILITGGRGQMGREVVKALMEAGEVEVVTLGRTPPEPVDCSGPGIHHVTGSVLDPGFMEQLLQQQEVTHLIHAAGVRTRVCAADPLLAYEGNVRATDRVFAAAAKCPSLEKVVHFSTAAVYGANQDRIDETASLAPSSPYAISKAASELIALGRGREAHFQTLILRPAFLLGPQMQSSLASFIRASLTNGELPFPFAANFHLHWAPDFARSLVQLLRLDWPKPLLKLHLPGEDLRLEDFAEVVRTEAQGQGFAPLMQLTPQLDAAVPARLEYSEYSHLVGENAPRTSVRQMVRSLLLLASSS